MSINNIQPQLFSSDASDSLNNLAENGIPAFTTFEVFPRFTKVDAGTTSNVEVNLDAMFSGTNQWNINNSYAKDVYVTIYDKENPINSKIYKTLTTVPSGIEITDTDYWQDETSTYFEIKSAGKAYHKYINSISKCYTHAICIKSTFDPQHQNVIIDWGDGISASLSDAIKLNDDQDLLSVLGQYADGSADIIYENPIVKPKNQFGKNECYTYYCYHDYMQAMIKDKIVNISVNDETVTATQGLPDQPYRVLIYGTTFYGIGRDGGISLQYYIDPERDYDITTGAIKTTGTRSIKSKFSHVLLSRIFDPDLPFFPHANITLASLANRAKNLLYINIPKYFDAFNNVINTYEMFERCTNLQYCNGFNNKLRFKSIRGMCRMFNCCENLLKCDITLAKYVVDHNVNSVHDGNKEVFSFCSKLAVDIMSLLPIDGFSARYMNLTGAFSGCRSLDIADDYVARFKRILYKDNTKVWKTHSDYTSDNSHLTGSFDKGTILIKDSPAFYGCTQLNQKKLSNGNSIIPNGWKNLYAYSDPDFIIVDIPKLNNLTYTGTEQTIIIPSNVGYTIINDNSELTKTDVGTYKVTLKLNEGYIWSDKTVANKEITWQITQATNEWITEPSIDDDEWREDETPDNILTIGDAKFGIISVMLNDKSFDIDNNKLPTEPGDYTLTFIVEGNDNYTRLSKTINFKVIDRPDIIEPIISDYQYTGNEQHIITINDNDNYTVTGTTSATDVGEYSFTITPNDGYEWPDNTDEERTFNWQITKATNEWITDPKISKSSWYDDEQPGILTDYGTTKFGEVVMKLNDETIDALPTEPGTYTIEFVVEGTNNYDGLSKSINIEILKSDSQLTIDDITLNSDYGEVITGLGENQDEVALVFKNSDLESMEWTVPGKLTNVQFLVVGGGGGGGSGTGGGGGGGGGVVTGCLKNLFNRSKISITVGKGGDGGPNTNVAAGKKGEDSSFDIDTIPYVIAYGGGNGGGSKSAGIKGGSGSGGRAGSKVGGSATQGIIYSDVANNILNGELFGNKGGTGASSYSAGGGGGAKSIADNGEINVGGNGGGGFESNITGEALIYGAGGGGGTSRASTVSGSRGGYGGGLSSGSGAGKGGGGKGGDATSGIANRGGGGGGGSSHSSNGGNGGSGIVVLRFKI